MWFVLQRSWADDEEMRRTKQELIAEAARVCRLLDHLAPLT
jgi:hypothetical protein